MFLFLLDKDHPKAAYQKKAKSKGRTQAKLTPSKELAEIIGKERVGRGESIKKLWEYIKKHNLQNPDNKREIIPDDQLEKVFGSSQPVSMFQLAGILTKHLS